MADALLAAIRALAKSCPRIDIWTVADTLWLGAITASATEPTVEESTEDPRPEATPSDTPRSTTGLSQPRSPARTGRSGAPMFERLQESSTVSRVSPVTLPASRPLANSLVFGRALQPFMRRWRHGTCDRLDIDATVDDYARSGILTPIMTPEPERWFEVTLIQDTTASMAIWRSEIHAFTDLLRNMGAFHAVRTWQFDPDQGILTDDRGRTDDNPLRRFGGRGTRQLLVIVSDFAAAGWRTAPPWVLLHALSTTTATVLLDPLPTRLWPHSALDHPIVRVRAARAGAHGSGLRYHAPLALNTFAEPPDRWQPIPVAGLTPGGLARWARALMRTEPDGCDAMLVPASGRGGASESADMDVSTTDLVSAYLHTASPAAVRLAVVCSGLDRLSLPLLQLIRTATVPEAHLADIAEFLVSGLLVARSTDGQDPILSFRPGSAEQLRDHLTYHDAWQTFDAISRHVARQHIVPGSANAGIAAAASDPSGGDRLPIESQPFAAATLRLVDILGIDRTLMNAEAEAAIVDTGREQALLRLLDHFHDIAPAALDYLGSAEAKSDWHITQNEVRDWLRQNQDAFADTIEIARAAGRHADAEDLATVARLFFRCPPEIQAGGVEAVLAFLRDRQAGSEPQWTSRLLMVGEGGAGKTSLVRALTADPHDPHEPSTHGLLVREIILSHPDKTGVRIRLRAWDFGGQQIYHATHQFFLTNPSIFLVVWNARLGWEQGKLNYWLDIITARAPESPIILVGTHSDTHPVDLPLAELRSSHPMIVASVLVENTTGTGFDELRSLLAAQAVALPLMGAEWPRTWLAAANAVRGIPENVVLPSRMWQMMAAAGVTNAEQQRFIARALHELGDILYYMDDLELSEFVVLRPEWVVDYITRVLDSDDVVRRGGLLIRDHLNELWPDLDLGVRDYLLCMMDKYDLSYRIASPRSSELSLVMERLPWDPPDYHQEWDGLLQRPDTREITVIYRLNTMPPGIPTWFIARSHRFSKNIHWHMGALLGHSDGRHLALIIADRRHDTVELAVRGPSPAGFFAVLDDGLNLTLDRFPGLSITRQVPCRCSLDCTELYDYESLRARLARTPPRTEVECHRTGELVSVPELLFGLAPSEREAISARIEQLTKTLVQFGDQLGEQAAYAQRMFLRLQRLAQQQQEADCPGVFAIVRTKSEYEIHVYCEEPGAWHRLPRQRGVYPVTQPKEWLARLGPYAQHLTTTLKRAAPATAPILGIAVDTLNAQIKTDSELMGGLLDELPNEIGPNAQTGPTASIPETESHAAPDADFRTLRAMWITLDPTQTWGGLSRFATPEGLTLYLCEYHLTQYQPGAADRSV